MEQQMQSTRLYGKQFAPNLSKKNAFMMYFIGTMFLVMGTMLYIFSYPRTLFSENPGPVFGVAFFGFGAIMLIVMYFLSPIKAGYYVNHTGVVLKRGRHVIGIPFDKIREIHVLDEKNSERRILHLEKHYFINDNTKYMNFVPNTKGMRVVFGDGRFGSFMFMSSIISSWRVGQGPVDGIDLPGDSVEIHLKNCDSYLITPLDSLEFVKEVKVRMPTR